MAVAVHQSVSAADTVGEKACLDGPIDVFNLPFPVLKPLLFLVCQFVYGIKHEGIQHLPVVVQLLADTGLAHDGVLAEGVDRVVFRLDEPLPGLVDDAAFAICIGDHAVSVIKDELCERIAMIREQEIDDDLALVVDETDVPVPLDGGQTLGEDPGTAILGRDRNLARVHVVVAALIVRAEHGEGIVPGPQGPVDPDVLDGHDARSGVLDGDFAIFAPVGDEVVVQKHALVGDGLDNLRLVAGGAAGDEGNDGGGPDDGPGSDGADELDRFHF